MLLTSSAPPASLPAPRRLVLAAAGTVALSGAGLLSGQVDPPDRRRQLHARPGPAPRRGRRTPWHEDVDRRPGGPCGGYKCFFPSLADPSRGYLIYHPSRVHRDSGEGGDTGEGEDPPPLDGAVRAYEYARGLEEELGVRHFYAAPPFEAEAPGPFVDDLQVPLPWARGGHGGAASLIVQPMRTAPEGSAVVKCFHLERLAAQPVVQGMDAGARATLLGELRRAVEVVVARPELLRDFQLMIDPRGRAYHLDFDRAFADWVFVGARLLRDAPAGGCLEGAIEHMVGSAFEGELTKRKLTAEKEEKEERTGKKERRLNARRRRAARGKIAKVQGAVIVDGRVVV